MIKARNLPGVPSYFLLHYSINSVLSIISIRALMSILECSVLFKYFPFAQMPSHIAVFLEVAQLEFYCLLLWDVSPNISCYLLWFMTQTATSHLHTMLLIFKVFWYSRDFLFLFQSSMHYLTKIHATFYQLYKSFDKISTKYFMPICHPSSREMAKTTVSVFATFFKNMTVFRNNETAE